MTTSPSLHLVIYSQLHDSGGGRETWLGYFLPQIAQGAEFSAIHVYALQPRDDCTSLLKMMERLGIEAVLADVNPGQRGGPLSNVARFALKTYRAMQSRVRDGDIVLLIGTVAEGVVAWLGMCGLSRRTKWVTWLRSIHVGELATYRSGLLLFAARHIETRVLKQSNLVLANGEDTLTYYTRKFPALRDRVRLVPNAVDGARFRGLKRPSFSDRPLKIAYLGRLAKAKGFPDFTLAAERCGLADSQIEFHVWGGELPEPRSGGTIRCHGAFSPAQLPAVLAQVDAVVFLNRAAAGKAGGLSHSLLEVLASGRLAIAWENASHCQILDPNCAILVPEGDVTALAGAFRSLPQIEPHRLARIAREGELRSRRFSPEHHVHCFKMAMDSLA